MARLKSVCAFPTPPCAHIIFAVFRKNYKTAKMAPRITSDKKMPSRKKREGIGDTEINELVDTTFGAIEVPAHGRLG